MGVAAAEVTGQKGAQAFLWHIGKEVSAGDPPLIQNALFSRHPLRTQWQGQGSAVGFLSLRTIDILGLINASLWGPSCVIVRRLAASLASIH